MIGSERIVEQFRRIAVDRVGRIEAAWTTALNELDARAAGVILRELHTLKGEACLVGFADLGLVCHKLEDLFTVARGRGFAVDDEFDFAVSMALRFMVMLVRKNAGAQLAGIDLPGFLREIDRVLAGPCGDVAGAPGYVSVPHRSTGTRERVPAALRPRLSEIAVDAFLEYAAAQANRRNRLRTSWHALRDMVGVHRAMISAGQLQKHKTSTRMLAQQLGKQAQLVLELESAEVTTEVLAALDAATLHLVRNAVDHGIEPSDARTATGKPAVGRIVIRGGMRADVFELCVTDDGSGIAFDRVKQRGIELGLIDASEDAIEDGRWIDLLCHPGLSTRGESTHVSGRGIGLDTVRASVLEVGGALSMSSRAGSGTTWILEIPVASMVVDGYMFRAPGVPVPVIVDSTWELASASPGSLPVADLASLYGLPSDDAQRGEPIWFARDGAVIGIAAERTPVRVQARKLVVTVSGLAEVVTIDGIEALSVRPQRLLDASASRQDRGALGSRPLTP